MVAPVEIHLIGRGKEAGKEHRRHLYGVTSPVDEVAVEDVRVVGGGKAVLQNATKKERCQAPGRPANRAAYNYVLVIVSIVIEHNNKHNKNIKQHT